MEYKLDISDSGNVISFIGNEDVFVDGERVTEIYVDYEDEEFLVWRYDVTPPTVIVSNVTNNSADYTLTDMDNFTVTMTAVDYDSGIASITVNNVAATNTENNTWTATIPLVEGQQTLVVKATDIAGNSTQQTCYIQKLIKTVPYTNDLTLTDSKHANGFTAQRGSFFHIGAAQWGQYVETLRDYTEKHSDNPHDAIYATTTTELARVLEPDIVSVTTSNGASYLKIIRCDGVVVYNKSGANQTLDLVANGWNRRIYYAVTGSTNTTGGYGGTISACTCTLKCNLS